MSVGNDNTNPIVNADQKSESIRYMDKSRDTDGPDLLLQCAVWHAILMAYLNHIDEARRKVILKTNVSSTTIGEIPRSVQPSLPTAPHVLVFELMFRTQPEILMVCLCRELDHVGSGGAERENNEQVGRRDARLRDWRRQKEAFTKRRVGVHV